MKNKIRRLQKLFEKEFGINNIYKVSRERSHILARSCFHKYAVEKFNISYAELARFVGAKPETVRSSIVSFENYAFNFPFILEKYNNIRNRNMRNKITNEEIVFMQELLERNKRSWNGHDVVLADSKLHNVDIYFLQQKLDELRDDIVPKND